MRFPRPEVIRSLFPSWRFFNRPGVYTSLWTRTRGEDGAWMEWKEWVEPKTPHSWLQILFNPSGNQRLYFDSLKDRLLQSASDSSESGLLQILRKEFRSPFQFKLEVGGEVALISEEIGQ